MRVVTWNLGSNSGFGSRAAWDYLLDELKPDVALLQEAVVPADLDRSLAFAKPWPARRWGSAVVTSRGAINKTFADTSYGPVVIAELNSGVVVGSLHARIIENRTIPSLQKTMSAVAPFLKGRQFVIGGDLNTARAADAIWPGHGHLEFFEFLTGRGLYDCYWEVNDRTETRSFWGDVSPHELQLDHLFVDLDTGMNGRVRSCQILDPADYRKLSDHSPVVAEIEF